MPLARFTSIALAAITWGLVSPALATQQAQIPSLKAPLTTDLAQAPGDILLQTSGSLGAGDSTLNDGSFYDVYPFEGEAGQTITIQLESSDFDTYLLLTDADGQALIENDDVSSGNFNSALTYTLPSSGTYNAIANSYDATGRGSYQITVTVGGNCQCSFKQWQRQTAVSRGGKALATGAIAGRPRSP
jgi:hypothetical protein